MPASRRDFMKLAGAGALLAPLAAFYSRAATGAPVFGPGFGPLAAALPLNSHELVSYRLDGSLAFDYRNLPLISLPKDFRYWVVSWTGQTMSDGSRVPGDHDGMAAYRGPRGTTILVRNHELSNREAKFGDHAGVVVPDYLKYDPWCNGGTTTLVLDEKGHLVRDFASLGGTNNNCAGGLTPWGTWLSCEENVSLPSGTATGYQKRHGYVFEVPANASGPVMAEPLVAMGRFNHEATANDPKTGIVYQTEDRGDSCFYRFIPHEPGKLMAGGKLQALKLRDYPAADTKTGFLGLLNHPLACEWVDIDNVDPDTDSVRYEAHAKGAAKFSRGEGVWYGDGRVYFVCSNGGDLGKGQVWAYDPAANAAILIVESTDASVLEAPDNLTVGPDGRLYLYEDGAGGNNIVGVNSRGELFRVAENAIGNGSEFAGGCFSHNGRFMFVNMQNPGLTLVIEGPWRKGRA
ncbi:MAG: alkaline phosphatase PhoX [Pseudomonadota bacterium]